MSWLVCSSMVCQVNEGGDIDCWKGGGSGPPSSAKMLMPEMVLIATPNVIGRFPRVWMLGATRPGRPPWVPGGPRDHLGHNMEAGAGAILADRVRALRAVATRVPGSDRVIASLAKWVFPKQQRFDPRRLSGGRRLSGHQHISK
ncbi:hypothetical protein TIFTF001_035670 [Ficus carica]|uniref:Uncharacterized protein n=1 Tax=Ficus carica TaxID=3494 RepID=A0AA88E208_FICCA|nr:hypothetical protein TIFTF001_035670 [Ficus carica]